MMGMIRKLRHISEQLSAEDAKFLEHVADTLDAQQRKIIELEKNVHVLRG